METMTTFRPFRSEKVRERAKYLAHDMQYNADGLDKLADDVDEWGLKCDPRAALGLIERAQRFVGSGNRWEQDRELIGERTSCSILWNDGGIALGIGKPESRGDMGYALMYAVSEFAKYGERGADSIQPSYTAVKASSIRVYASGLRVLAGMLEDVATGKLGWIR